MRKRIPLEGRRFGYLTVLEFDEASTKERGNTMWLCRCDCGAIGVFRGSKLVEGVTSSCGCFRREIAKVRFGTHGMKNTRTYTSWRAMRSRCLRVKDIGYSNYGGRGINVCERWMDSFENFLADMGPAPDGMTLDRFPDPNGNYEPGNCRWATKTEQSRNRRTNFMVAYNGKTQCLQSWSDELGINYRTLLSRLKTQKLPPEIAFQNAPTKGVYNRHGVKVA